MKPIKTILKTIFQFLLYAVGIEDTTVKGRKWDYKPKKV